MPDKKKRVIYVAMAGNLGIAIMKFFAAVFTGSSAILAEGIHSVVDTANEMLLVLGMRRSQQPADARHPYGYGKELYFWSLMVAVVLFGIGGGITIYEGILHLLAPHALKDSLWAYVVLGISALLEGISWSVALREILASKGEHTLWQTMRRSYDPSVFTVLLEDTAALIGITIAFLGIYLAQRYNNPLFDGAASILIGVTLCVVALLLIRESKDLLVGESAKPEVNAELLVMVGREPGVATVKRLLTMVVGPEEILLNIEAQFAAGMSANDVAETVNRLEMAIRQRYPRIKKIFIEAEPLATPVVG